VGTVPLHLLRNDIITHFTPVQDQDITELPICQLRMGAVNFLPAEKHKFIESTVKLNVPAAMYAHVQHLFYEFADVIPDNPFDLRLTRNQASDFIWIVQPEIF
jgi:hypothetical protein